MMNPYHLQRACEVIASINTGAMSPEDAIAYAKRLAEKGLANYGTPVKKPEQPAPLPAPTGSKVWC